MCRLVDGDIYIYTPWIGRGQRYAKIRVDGPVYGHRAVAWSFLFVFALPGYVVDHIDRDKWNNAVSNLRWVSVSENEYNRGFVAPPERAVMCCHVEDINKADAECTSYLMAYP